MKYLIYLIFVFLFFQYWRQYQAIQKEKERQENNQALLRQKLFQLETDFLNHKISREEYEKRLKELQK